MTWIPVVLFFLIFFLLIETILLLRPAPITGTLAFAFIGIIALESIVFNGLSVFSAVNSFNVLWGHVLVVLTLMVLVFRLGRGRLLNHMKRFFNLLKKEVKSSQNHLILPLLVLVGLTAWLYPPNNYDSLTYHMARVLHWIQNGSVAYYPTPIERQNVMGPGVEYIFLFFQLLSHSDLLATSVQFIAYCLLIPSCIYICRIIRLPKVLAFFVVVLTLTAPITIFEISNTKNDIVAALTGYAMIIACRHWIVGHIEKMKVVDFVFLGISTGAAFIVKPTAILVAFPIIGISFCSQLLTVKCFRKYIPLLLKGIVVALICFSVVAGPDIYRKAKGSVARHEVYSLFSGYDADRLWNPVKGLAHNVPFQEEGKRIYERVGGIGNFRTRDVFNMQEDMVGNPYQVVAFAFLSVVTMLLGFVLLRTKKQRHRLVLSLAPIFSWVLFGLMVKDQAWITRLQIPLFCILPFSFVGLLAILWSQKLLRTPVYLVMLTVSILSLSYALLVATNVPARPLILRHFWGEKPSRDLAYYNNIGLKKEHDFFLQKMQENNCKNVGLLFGSDSVEYPLALRAERLGAQVRHLWQKEISGGQVKYRKIKKEFDRACILYVAHGSIEHVPEKGKRWISAGDYHTFVKDYSWDFDSSGVTCLSSKSAGLNFAGLNEVEIKTGSNGVSVVALGNDPQLVVSGIDKCTKNSNAAMRLQMNSPVHTVVQIFYQTEKKPYYDETMSVKKEIFPGENVVFLFLPTEKISGQLRLDVGQKAGLYEIHSLEIRNY